MELKRKIIASAFAGVLGAATTFIQPEEGIKFQAYQDSVKVWTVCVGHTGPDVVKNKRYSQAECDALFKSDIWIAMEGVLKATPNVKLPDPVLVSFTSFAFNVGVDKFRTSTMAKLANSGDFAAACHQLPRWKFAGGYDCSVRSNQCYGVWTRRLKEEANCMSALK